MLDLVHGGSLRVVPTHYVEMVTPELPDELHPSSQSLPHPEISKDTSKEERIASLRDVSTCIESLSREVLEDAIEESKKSILACSDANSLTGNNDKFYYAFIFGEDERQQVIAKLSRISLSEEDKKCCHLNPVRPNRNLEEAKKGWSKELVNQYGSLNHRYFWIIEGNLKTEKRESGVIEKDKISLYMITFMDSIRATAIHSDFTSQQRPKPSPDFNEKVKIIVNSVLLDLNDKLHRQFNRKKLNVDDHPENSSLFRQIGKVVLTVLL